MDDDPYGDIRGVTLSGILRNAANKGEATARQIAANYQDLASPLISAYSNFVGKPSDPETVRSPVDPARAPGAYVSETGFAQRSSDPTVQASAILADPLTYAGGGAAAGTRKLAQMATARALREAGERAARQEARDAFAAGRIFFR